MEKSERKESKHKQNMPVRLGAGSKRRAVKKSFLASLLLFFTACGEDAIEEITLGSNESGLEMQVFAEDFLTGEYELVQTEGCGVDAPTTFSFEINDKEWSAESQLMNKDEQIYIYLSGFQRNGVSTKYVAYQFEDSPNSMWPVQSGSFNGSFIKRPTKILFNINYWQYPVPEGVDATVPCGVARYEKEL